MKLKALIAGLAGIAMFGTAATAADIPVIVPAPAPVVVAPVAPGFDWSGIYVGAFVQPSVGWEFGGAAGFNMARGNFVFGAEGRVGLIGLGAITLGGAVKAGVTLGAQDRILVYGATALEFIPAGPVSLFTVTGGTAIGIGERISIFGEAGVIGALGGGCCGITFRGGLNFHL